MEPTRASCAECIVLALLLAAALPLNVCAQLNEEREPPSYCEDEGTGCLAAAATSPDVLIIGAGMAGASAAQYLKSKGYSVKILEARSRLGGRIWSNADVAANFSVDLGAGWIEGTTNNPVNDLAMKYNISTWVTNWNSEILYGQTNTRVSDSDQNQYWQSYKNFDSYLNDFEDQVTKNDYDTTTSVLDVLKKWLSSRSIIGTALSGLLSTINNVVEQEYAADIANLGMGFNWDSGTPGQQLLMPKGYLQIVQRLSQDIDIQYRRVVTKIDFKPQSVTITVNNTAANVTETFTSKYAVITLPVGVLRANKVTFTPSLSTSAPAKWRAINRLGLGLLDKVVLKFNRTFWDNVQVIDRIPSNLTTPGQTCMWCNFINYHYHSKVPILIAFNAGGAASSVESMDDATVIQSVMTALKGLYGSDIPNPTSYIITRWGKDPYSLMSYSYLKVGAVRGDYAAMASPIQNTLFWAGEATLKTWPASVRGAYISGQTAGTTLYNYDRGAGRKLRGVAAFEAAPAV